MCASVCERDLESDRAWALHRCILHWDKMYHILQFLIGQLQTLSAFTLLNLQTHVRAQREASREP